MGRPGAAGVYMSTFVFTSPEELRREIISALEEAEKRAKARTLPRERLGEVVEAVTFHPAGYVRGDGGGVPKSYRYRAETTHFTLAWYTWRREKHVFLSACRGYAEKVKYGSLAGIVITADRRSAYETVFPDRARVYHGLRDERRIHFAVRHLPPLPAGVGKITTVRPDTGGLVVADTSRYMTLVGTPAGWIPAPSRGWEYRRTLERRSAWNILRDIGFPVPRMKKNRVWSGELTAFAAMLVLGLGGVQA